MIKDLVISSCYVLIGLMIIMYLLQRHLIYFPAREVPSRQLFHANDMDLVQLHTDDGLVLNAWYKSALAHKPTIVYLHGNAGHIGYRMPLARQFLVAGFGVLLVDYRGYGGNTGRPSENGLYKDGRAAVNFLQQKGTKPGNIILYGESLGSGVATQLATEFPVCALILQSPYTSLKDVGRYHYPWILIPPWDKYNSLSRIGKIKMPLLILHGKEDEIVPFSLGLQLFEQAKEPKKMIGLEHKGHNNLWDSNFANHIIEFMRANCN